MYITCSDNKLFIYITVYIYGVTLHMYIYVCTRRTPPHREYHRGGKRPTVLGVPLLCTYESFCGWMLCYLSAHRIVKKIFDFNFAWVGNLIQRASLNQPGKLYGASPTIHAYMPCIPMLSSSNGRARRPVMLT